VRRQLPRRARNRGVEHDASVSGTGGHAARSPVRGRSAAAGPGLTGIRTRSAPAEHRVAGHERRPAADGTRAGRTGPLTDATPRPTTGRDFFRPARSQGLPVSRGDGATEGLGSAGSARSKNTRSFQARVSSGTCV